MQPVNVRKMTDVIDKVGNALADVCSDSKSLQYLIDIFDKTGFGFIFRDTSSTTWDNKAWYFKFVLCHGLLRLIRVLIYADDIVEEVELDAAYPFLKPLAYVLSRVEPNTYSQFENLDRANVTAFLNRVSVDSFADYSRTMKYAKNEKLRDALTEESADMVCLEQENPDLTLVSLVDESDNYTQNVLTRTISYISLNGAVEVLDDGTLNGDTADAVELLAAEKTGRAKFAVSIDWTQTVGKITSMITKRIKSNPRFAELCLHQTLSPKKPIPSTSHFPDHCFLTGNSGGGGAASKTSAAGSIMTTSHIITSSEKKDSSEVKTPQETALDEALEEINALEGLPAVKSEINKLIDFLKVQSARKATGMKTSVQALHYVFTGNPGTGKTTVARIFAKILYGFKMLQTQKLTETDRGGLVGGYVGQTAIKTNEVIDSALDGVLFIDEAYALNKGGIDYGQEAVDTLLKRMEDSRSRLVVIVAGYPDLMKQFIDSNPGLQSRFTRYLSFADYSVPEMCRIYEKMCTNGDYHLTPAARATACVLFALAYHRKDEHFGNARFVRNVYEQTTMMQSARLAPLKQIPKEMLLALEGGDIPLSMIAGFDVSGLDISQSLWITSCPKCGQEKRAAVEFLGESVVCRGCDTEFIYDWWKPVADTISGVETDVWK